jgi:hypothetical protein
MKPMRKLPRKSHVFGALALVLATMPATTARADAYTDFKSNIGKSLENIFYLTAASLIVDVTFTIHDATLQWQNKRQSTGWAIAETALTLPQVGLFNAGLTWAHSKGDNDDISTMDALAVIPSVWTSQLATHGIWSLASDKVRLGDLYGVSWAIGANLTFTVGAVSGLFGKRLGGPIFGIMEMVGTTPSIAVGLYRSLGKVDADQPAWIALTAWSGVLWVHGLASTVIPNPKKNTDEKKSAARRLPFTATPTVVSDGYQQMPGIAVRGIF